MVAVGGDGGAGKTPDIFDRGPAGRGIQVRSQPRWSCLSAIDSDFASGAGTGGGGAIWVAGPNATANIVGSKLEGTDPISGYGITGFDGARLSLDSVEIDANRGSAATIYEGSMTVRRSRILGEYALDTVASGGTTSTAEVIDSLLILHRRDGRRKLLL